MSLNKDEKKLLIFVLWFLGLALLVGSVWYLIRAHRADDEAKAAAKLAALTHVKPIRPKTLVKKSDNLDALATTVNSGGQTSNSNEGGPSQNMPEVSADVGNLPTLASVNPETQAPAMRPIVAAVEKSLPRQSLCYRGALPHVGPSLYDLSGFAISFGPDDINQPDAFPRIEFFFNARTYPPSASFVSITDDPVQGFTKSETAMAYSGTALHQTIQQWITGVASDLCPAR